MFRATRKIAPNAARKLLQTQICCETMAAKRGKVLSVDNINPHVKKMEYAVRGPIVIRAGEIEQELKSVSNLLFALPTYDFLLKIQKIM